MGNKSTKLAKFKQESQDRQSEAAIELAQSVTPAEASKNGVEKKAKFKGEAPSKMTVGLTDVGASVFAQGFTEGWGYLMRAAGKWSVDGFLAEQNDILQATGPSVAGALWYLVELYKLGKTPPSAFKMGRLEAAKLLGNLGLSKLFQALRSRSSEAKKALDDARKEAAQYLADNKAQAANLERMQSQLGDLQKQLKEQQAKANGGGGR